MEKIRELLGRLANLTPDELAGLKTEVIAEFDRVHDEDTTADSVATLNELAEAGNAIMVETQARETAQAEAEQAKSAAAEQIKALKGEGEDGEGAEEDGAEDGEEADEAEVAAPGAGVEGAEEDEDEDELKKKGGAEAGEEVAEEVAVAASGVRAVAAGTRGRKPEGSPEAGSSSRRGRARVLVASAFGGSEETEDRMAVARVMCDRLGRMMRHGPPQGVALCASAEWEYPEDRDLRNKDAFEVSKIMEATSGVQAVVASGGICLPVNVDYAIPTFATADRPLKEGLPSYQATRGGLRFVEPPDIGPLGAATGVWTAATDAEPLAATKPVFSVSCGTEQLVYVAAISTRVGFGNMQSRFQPELVAANTDLAIAAAARKAELRLLELIQEKCVKDVTSAKVLGATRDLATAVQQATAFFRYYHRLPRGLTLTAVFPDWLKEVIKIDLARETAHQQDSSWNSLMISDQQVEDLVRAWGVNPIWTLDALPEKAGGTGYPTQQLALQAAEGAINKFPTKLVWNMFPEGSMQFLDGGRLDLGVVRDSTLDATNDYETFVETFEGLADRGFANSALQLVTELCANGKSGATETVSTCA
jgi:hypothetical protein